MIYVPLSEWDDVTSYPQSHGYCSTPSLDFSERFVTRSSVDSGNVDNHHSTSHRGKWSTSIDGRRQRRGRPQQATATAPPSASAFSASRCSRSGRWTSRRPRRRPRRRPPSARVTPSGRGRTRLLPPARAVRPALGTRRGLLHLLTLTAACSPAALREIAKRLSAFVREHMTPEELQAAAAAATAAQAPLIGPVRPMERVFMRVGGPGRTLPGSERPRPQPPVPAAAPACCAPLSRTCSFTLVPGGPRAAVSVYYACVCGACCCLVRL